MPALVGILYWKKFNKTPVKYFIVFLVFTCIADTINNYTKFVEPGKALDFLIGTKFEKNHWWNTSFWIIGAIMFFAFFYRKILKTSRFKKIIKITSYSFFVFSITYIVKHWDYFFGHNFTILELSGAVIIFFCTVFYFIEILVSDEILVFYKSIYFYISAVIFIWWLIITPLTFYDIYHRYEIGSNDFDRNFFDLRFMILLSANFFMYVTYTFALLWCRPENEF